MLAHRIMKTFNPNNSGKRLLVEECQKVSINQYLRGSKVKIKEALLSSKIDIAGVSIGLTTSGTNFGGIRYWFKCPSCNRRVGTLFVHPLRHTTGCRGCLGLEYRSRRYKGMVEARIG